MTGKQRIVLAALRDAQHVHGRPVSSTEVAEACVEPWHRKSKPVNDALLLLGSQGLVQLNRTSNAGWRLTVEGRLRLPPRRGPARTRRPIPGPRRTDPSQNPD